MLLTKKIKICLKSEDQDRLIQQAEFCRQLYNLALEQRIMAYKGQRKSLTIYDQKKELPELKKNYPEFQQVYNKYLSATLFRLDEAFKSFFQRVRQNGVGKKGFPRFRGRNYFLHWKSQQCISVCSQFARLNFRRTLLHVSLKTSQEISRASA